MEQNNIPPRLLDFHCILSYHTMHESKSWQKYPSTKIIRIPYSAFLFISSSCLLFYRLHSLFIIKMWMLWIYSEDVWMVLKNSSTLHSPERENTQIQNDVKNLKYSLRVHWSRDVKKSLLFIYILLHFILWALIQTTPLEILCILIFTYYVEYIFSLSMLMKYKLIWECNVDV